MKEQELLKSAYIRTVVACLEVASYTINQLKLGETHKARQNLGIVEKQIDGFLAKVRLSVLKRDGQSDLSLMNNEFNEVTNFINEILAIASIIPNDPALQKGIIDGFNEVCKNQLSVKLLNNGS